MDSLGGETARGGKGQRRHEVGGGDGNETLNARSKPDDTDATKLLFGGDAEARKGQAIERMGRIGDLDLLGWGDADANRGSVLCGYLHIRASTSSAGIARAPMPTARAKGHRMPYKSRTAGTCSRIWGRPWCGSSKTIARCSVRWKWHRQLRQQRSQPR